MLLHEVFHIKYKSFQVKPEIQNGPFHFIWNVICDAQIEYNGTMEHPSLVQLVRWLMIALKRDTDLSQVQADFKQKERVQLMFDTLFTLTRFGAVPPGADPDYVEFLMPHVLSGTRGDVTNVMTTARTIYEYIMASVDENMASQLQKIPDYLRGASAGDMKKIQGMKRVISTNAMDVVKQAMQTGQIAGAGETEIVIKEEESDFYRQTVEKHSALIKDIRMVFKRQLEKLLRVSRFSGDLNMDIRNLQRAYEESFWHAETPHYHQLHRREPSLDLVIIRDISGSTGSIKEQYAEFVIVLLAAVAGLFGIRVAEIDFSDNAIANLEFDQSLRKSRIFPRCEGGTQLLPALDVMQKLNWRQRKRRAIIITDGDIYDYDHAKPKMQEIGSKLDIKYFMYNIGSYGSNADLIKTTMLELPRIFLKTILRDL